MFCKRVKGKADTVERRALIDNARARKSVTARIEPTHQRKQPHTHAARAGKTGKTGDIYAGGRCGSYGS